MENEEKYADDFDQTEDGKEEDDPYAADGFEDVHDSPVKGRPLAQPAAASWDSIAFSDVQIGPRIGGGGFAVVHSGEWKGRPVAVKQLIDSSPEVRSEFLDELHILARAAHEGVVKLHGACTNGPNQLLVMELCGRSLFSVLHEGGQGSTPGLATRLTWAAQAAGTVAFLHGLSPAVIHRDIKTANVLLPPSGSPAGSPVRLVDFGLSASRVRQAGTPAAMAPELLLNKPHGRPADVYALGILIWELAACRLPHAGRSPADLLRSVPQGERPPLTLLPRDGPPALPQLIQACWDGEPAKRPSAAQVASQLTDILAQVKAGPSAGTTAGGASGPGRPASGWGPGGAASGPAAAPLDALDSLGAMIKAKAKR